MHFRYSDYEEGKGLKEGITWSDNVVVEVDQYEVGLKSVIETRSSTSSIQI